MSKTRIPIGDIAYRWYDRRWPQLKSMVIVDSHTRRHLIEAFEAGFKSALARKTKVAKRKG